MYEINLDIKNKQLSKITIKPFYRFAEVSFESEKLDFFNLQDFYFSLINSLSENKEEKENGPGYTKSLFWLDDNGSFISIEKFNDSLQPGFLDINFRGTEKPLITILEILVKNNIIEEKDAQQIIRIYGQQTSEIQQVTTSNFKFSFEAEQKSYTPLMVAVSENNLDVTVKLIVSGSNINARSLLGNTALMFASQKGRQDIVDFLVEKGANLDDKNRIGWNAFIYAAEGNNLSLIQWLADHKSISPTAYEINAALLLAASSRNVSIVIYLLKRFATLAGDNKTIENIAKTPYFKIDIKSCVVSLDFARTLLNIEENEIEKLNVSIRADAEDLLWTRSFNNASLKELTYRCHDKHAAKFAQFLENASLRKFSFFTDNQGSIQAEHVTTLLAGLAKNKNSQLTELCLSYCDIDFEGSVALARLLIQSKSLSRLDLSHVKIDKGLASVIFVAISANPIILKYLDLSNCEIDRQGATSLANLLLNPQLSLETLKIGGIRNVDSSLLLIINAIKEKNSLLELDLSRTNLNDEEIAAIADMVASNKSIKSLDLSNNNLSDKQGEIIIGALKNNFCLEEIKLASSYGEMSVDMEQTFDLHTAEMLGKLFSLNTPIKKIDLSWHPKLGRHINYLSKGLATNTILTSLNLRDAAIDDKGFISLLNALSTNTSLEKLTIDSSSIGDRAANELALMLEKNQHFIKHLEIGGQITSAFRIKILQSLQKNNTLISLRLNDPINMVLGYSDTDGYNEVHEILVETLKYYNCTIQDIYGFIAPQKANEIKFYLIRNQRLAWSNLDLKELKITLDEIRKARWERKEPLINQPYSLRFMAGFYSQKLTNTAIKKDIIDDIYEKDKKGITSSFIC